MNHSFLVIGKKVLQTQSGFLLIACLILSMAIWSCGQEDDVPDPSLDDQVLTGVNLSFTTMDVNGETQASDNEPHSIMVSISDDDGNVIHDNLEIFRESSDDDLYVFQPVPLDSGTYYVTAFSVRDLEGNTIYLAPISGSDRALLVDNPLSQKFEIVSGEITTLIIETLATDSDDDPGSFGYGGFGGIQFKVVETFKLELVVFIFDTEISQLRLIPSHLMIEVDGVERVNKSLEPGANSVEVNDGGSFYRLTVNSEGNIDPYVKDFSLEELRAYEQGPNNDPLQIILQFHVNVQDRLDLEEHPFDIYKSGVVLDSLYGKKFGGGLIFYLDTLQGHGYVVSEQDERSLPFGCDGISLSTHGRNIGHGKLNTQLLVDAHENGVCTGNRGYHASTITMEGFDDWFLPSLDEQIAMFENLKKRGFGNFRNGYYWSSTTGSTDVVPSLHFGNGTYGNVTRNSTILWRVAREF